MLVKTMPTRPPGRAGSLADAQKPMLTMPFSSRGGPELAPDPDLCWCCIALQPAGLRSRVEAIRAGAGAWITRPVAERNAYGAERAARRRGATD
jgi:hypothetical protein